MQMYEFTSQDTHIFCSLCIVNIFICFSSWYILWRCSQWHLRPFSQHIFHPFIEFHSLRSGLFLIHYARTGFCSIPLTSYFVLYSCVYYFSFINMKVSISRQCEHFWLPRKGWDKVTQGKMLLFRRLQWKICPFEACFWQHCKMFSNSLWLFTCNMTCYYHCTTNATMLHKVIKLALLWPMCVLCVSL